jgi:hypothetical protein
MIKIKLLQSTLIKHGNGLNYTVEANKEVEVEEEFLRSLNPSDYELVKEKKKAEKDIEVPNKKTKEITIKEKKTK